MVASVTATPYTTPAILGVGAAKIETQPPVETEGAGTSPAVIVTLSDEAQEALATGAPPEVADLAPASAPTASDPNEAVRAQLDQAITTLNDVTGATSVEDQLAAYAFVNDTLLNGPARQGGADPNLGYAVDLANSAFAQHVDQLTAYMRDQGVSADNDMSPTFFASAAGDYLQKLAAFDGLSDADQQIYVGSQALSRQTTRDVFAFAWDQGAIIQTPADYRANLQAQADVMQALQGAMDDPRYAADTQMNGHMTASSSDRLNTEARLAQAAGDQQTTALLALRDYRGTADWTLKAQAYLTEYGAPSASASASGTSPPAFVAKPALTHSAAGDAAQRAVDAIQVMNDPRASSDEKFAALAASQGAGGLLSWLGNDTVFAKQVSAAQSQYQSAMMSNGVASRSDAGANPASGAHYGIDYFDGLSPDAQRSVAYGYGYTDLSGFRGFLTGVAAESDQFWAAQTDQPTASTTVQGSTTAAEQALERLRNQPFDANGAAALSILKSSAEAQKAWLDDARTPADPSDAGSRVNEKQRRPTLAEQGTAIDDVGKTRFDNMTIARQAGLSLVR